ncbi:ARL2BP [Cordylochernes scorpioides]|uniref:ADP-ribosylation factor-like protein 2-binding protein n=1 Tax=Cordylochernes scorpioides TaxID=51811 RepID=A0ABY6K457_9ARAC|nr:ARL2BP [Cordylochernes scorpioides]
MFVSNVIVVSSDPEFQHQQQSCLERHSEVFENSPGDGENKLEYTTAFNDYTHFIETHLEESLKKKIPTFSMSQFLCLLGSKKPDELDGEIFDLLISFSSFLHFKELMLDYKAVSWSLLIPQFDNCV